MAPRDVPARIKAARLLRGVSQQELAKRLADAGLSGRTAGALERGDMEMRAVHRAALMEALGVGEYWFTAPLDKILGRTGSDPAVSSEQRQDEILRRLDAISERLDSA